MSTNGDKIPKADKEKLEKILRKAKLKAAKDAQAKAKEHQEAVERAKQARIRAQRERKEGKGKK